MHIKPYKVACKWDSMGFHAALGRHLDLSSPVALRASSGQRQRLLLADHVLLRLLRSLRRQLLVLVRHTCAVWIRGTRFGSEIRNGRGALNMVGKPLF